MDIANGNQKIVVDSTDWQHHSNSTSPFLKFYASVEFGVLGKNCKNHGICRLNPLAETITTDIRRTTHCTAGYLALVRYWQDQRLDLEFLTTVLDAHCLKKYFSSDLFLVQEDFQTSFFRLRRDKKYWISIKKGKYPISKNKTHCVIHFFEKMETKNKYNP